MKTLLLLLIFSNSLLFCVAQPGQQITINEIGWTFTVPETYKLMDSSTKTYKIAPEVDYWTKRFMFLNNLNIFSAAISSVTNNSENERDRMYKMERNRSYEVHSKQKASLKIDSSTTITMVGNVPFYKFAITGKENGIVTYNHIELSKVYKGYKCMIVYTFKDILEGSEIEKILLNSKFTN